MWTALAPDTEDLETFEVEILASVGLMFLGGAVMALVLLRLARHAPLTLVTVALAILTLTCLLLYGATEQEALISLAGAGMGALAGAVTSLFQDGKDEQGRADSPRPRDMAWEDDDEAGQVEERHDRAVDDGSAGGAGGGDDLGDGDGRDR